MFSARLLWRLGLWALLALALVVVLQGAEWISLERLQRLG